MVLTFARQQWSHVPVVLVPVHGCSPPRGLCAYVAASLPQYDAQGVDCRGAAQGVGCHGNAKWLAACSCRTTCMAMVTVAMDGGQLLTKSEVKNRVIYVKSLVASCGLCKLPTRLRGWSNHQFLFGFFCIKKKKKWGTFVRNRFSGNFCWAEMRPKSE